MKRVHLIRCAAVVAAVALVASCDQRTPLNPFIGGGSGGGGVKGAPVVSIDTLQPSPVNVGDSILVAVHVVEDSSIASVQLFGLTVNGSADLGTLSISNRYNPITVGGFRSGLRDTVIRRYLHPATPVDTSLDSLVVVATATDNSSKTGADTAVVRVVTGPKVNFITPLPTTQVFAGGDMGVTAHATHADGVASLTINVQSLGAWPTPVNYTTTGSFPLGPKDTTWTGSVNVPLNAPVGGRLQFTASGIDVNGKPGSIALLTLLVKGQDTTPPLVTQVVSPRIELTDSVLVNSSGSSATVTAGVIVKDSIGVEIRRDSIAVATPLNNVSQWVHLPLTNAEQGRNLRISTFAIDRLGRKGYSVSNGTTVAQPTMARAWTDTTVVVYGRTYPLPYGGINTTVGDIAIDTAHGNVFVSNINNNRLEIWQGSTKTFASSGIPVGSEPWGLAFGNSNDTLYVANSGGTNISRVYVGTGTKAEVLSQRILTRNTYAFIVSQTQDINTGRITLSLQGPVSYSDRPQYLAVSKAGRVFYSTMPTASAPAGTIRWLDPALPVPDPQQIWQYGTSTGSGSAQWVLFNIDSAFITKFTGTIKSDLLTVYDHPYGQLAGNLVGQDSDVVSAVSKLGSTSDAELIANLDINSLALTDTTFLAESGDHTWVAFGEGNTGGAGRIMMVNDACCAMPGFFSPGVAVTDLIDNANERVFGVAVDSTGTTLAAHGNESYFAAIQNPFHLRLQGKYNSFDNGAGVAFHPGANGNATVSTDRLAFAGSQDGHIEIIDIAYFLQRGRLTLKGNLYGPLRASRPFPGDPPGTLLKLFGLSSAGLVVIDLTATDIKPGP
ncbi:MAG TPA: hypothetical protein VGH98_20615 [Gemmatimonadaceae bacterium]|jgi:hypothetical protein